MDFATSAMRPTILADRPELITPLTNTLILLPLAVRCDLCWGLSGVMSFSRALFFGAAGSVVALVGRDLDLSPLWATLPLAMVTGGVLATLLAAFSRRGIGYVGRTFITYCY